VYRAAGLSLEDIGELLDGNDDDVIARLSR
jgi:DNA-binding transcriptional MerR regulator